MLVENFKFPIRLGNFNKNKKPGKDSRKQKKNIIINLFKSI